MKDRWDKLKISSDILKDNKVIAFMLLSTIGGYFGNIYQGIVGQQDTSAIEVMKEHIAYTNKEYVLPAAKKEPKKTIIYKSNCGTCEAEIKKLKRWHE